jgi:excisionase family DNA binding protein
MKIELEQEDVQAIAKEVVEMLRPLLNHGGNGVGEDTIFDVQGMAEYLRVRKQWVYDKVHLNDIPHYKVGKYPRFRKSKIDEWLKQREKGNGRPNLVRNQLEDLP